MYVNFKNLCSTSHLNPNSVELFMIQNKMKHIKNNGNVEKGAKMTPRQD